jgi:hypothetical protein
MNETALIVITILAIILALFGMGALSSKTRKDRMIREILDSGLDSRSKLIAIGLVVREEEPKPREQWTTVKQPKEPHDEPD